MNKWLIAAVLAGLWLCAWPSRALAVGWDSDDFLIGGGPSFTTRIGVFDHDLTFKGYLDTDFVTVAGMDFDAAGHLVAVASGNVRSVRVYDSSGVIVGGFARSDDLLGTPGDLKVAPNGDYVIATQNFGGGDGAREFAPDGTFIRQYGSGDIRAATAIPANELWTGGIESPLIHVFDVDSGAATDTISVAGPTGFRSMTYSARTNTVLNVSGGAIWELDPGGNVIRSFTAPGVTGFGATARGPLGEVFATDGNQHVAYWSAGGQFIGTSTLPSQFLGYGIVWAGNVPEPMGMLAVIATAFAVSRKRLTRPRR